MQNVGTSSTLCLAFLIVPLLASLATSYPSNDFEDEITLSELPDKRGWTNFHSGGYGKRSWNSFNGGYGKRALDYDDEADLTDEIQAEKRAWNSGFAGGMGKRAWNSNFGGGMGKRAWNSNFGGGMGKRAWNSNFGGGMGKRAWNSNFGGGMGKRAWNSNFGGGMGKRAWNSNFGGGMGKRAMEMTGEENLSSLDKLEDGSVADLENLKQQLRDKKSWAESMPLWGKRSSNNATQRIKKKSYLVMTPHEYHALRTLLVAKRTRGWLALRGMWG